MRATRGLFSRARARRHAVAPIAAARPWGPIGAQLGDDAEPPEVTAWRAQVIAAGARPARVPDGQPHAGELASAKGSDRYNTRNVVYTLAPDAVRQADGVYSAQLASDVQAGEVADVVTAVLQPFADVGDAVLSIPRQAVAEAVGVPPNVGGWLIAGAAIVGGWLFLRKAK